MSINTCVTASKKLMGKLARSLKASNIEAKFARTSPLEFFVETNISKRKNITYTISLVGKSNQKGFATISAEIDGIFDASAQRDLFGKDHVQAKNVIEIKQLIEIADRQIRYSEAVEKSQSLMQFLQNKYNDDVVFTRRSPLCFRFTTPNSRRWNFEYSVSTSNAASYESGYADVLAYSFDHMNDEEADELQMRLFRSTYNPMETRTDVFKLILTAEQNL